MVETMELPRKALPEVAGSQAFLRGRIWAFANTLAAIVVSGFETGEHEVRALLRRLGEWRVGFGWYLVVLGLPFAEDLLAAGLASVTGVFSAARIPPILPVLPAMWVVFLFAAGEELGWRGFALPRLLVSRTAVTASLMLGAVHTAWHWPVILLPHQYLSDVPLLPWSVFVLSEAIVFTWIFQNTRGSVVMATLYPGSSNIGMVLYGGIDPAWAPWFKCSTSTLVALGLLMWAGPNLRRERRETARAGGPSNNWMKLTGPRRPGGAALSADPRCSAGTEGKELACDRYPCYWCLSLAHRALLILPRPRSPLPHPQHQ